MRKAIWYWLLLIMALIIGFITAIVMLRFQYFIQVLKQVDWTSLSFWLVLFLGALIPIVFSYLTIRKQEVMKLKAIFLHENAQIIREFLEWSVIFRTTVYTKKTKDDLRFEYICTPQDASAPTLRTLHVLTCKDSFSSFKLSWFRVRAKLSQLNNEAVNTEMVFIDNYLLNVEILFEKLPSSAYEEYGIALKNDFFNMGRSLDEAVKEYVDHRLFLLKIERDKMQQNEHVLDKRFRETNFCKYRDHFMSICCDTSI